jgi:hypothetical protein
MAIAIDVPDRGSPETTTMGDPLRRRRQSDGIIPVIVAPQAARPRSGRSLEIDPAFH